MFFEWKLFWTNHFLLMPRHWRPWYRWSQIWRPSLGFPSAQRPLPPNRGGGCGGRRRSAARQPGAPPQAAWDPSTEPAKRSWQSSCHLGPVPHSCPSPRLPPAPRSWVHTLNLQDKNLTFIQLQNNFKFTQSNVNFSHYKYKFTQILVKKTYEVH